MAPPSPQTSRGDGGVDCREKSIPQKGTQWMQGISIEP